jgi:single-stranded-DNA-specific exonuclease
MKVLKQIAPFGPENPRPVFEAKGLSVFNALSSFKDRHLKFLVAQNGSNRVFQTIGFEMADHYNRLAQGDTFRMAFTIEENTFNGSTTIQLRMKDIKFD